MEIKSIDVANALNLSKATVSLALNNKPGVSESTRQKIFKYIEQARSQPNDKGSIKLVLYNKFNQHLAYSSNHLLMDTIRGIESVAKNNGYSLEIAYFCPDTDDISLLLTQCNQSNISGVILMATDMNHSDFNDFHHIHKPMIVYDNYFHTTSCDTVTVDNDLAVYCALRHLINYNHRNIIYLSSESNIFNTIQRTLAAQKYKTTLFTHAETLKVYSVGMAIDQISQNISSLLANPKDKTSAFVCENYIVAIGLLNALSQCRLSTPMNYSIISIDALPENMLPLFHPSITYVDIPHESRGRLTTTRLIERIEGPSTEYMHIMMAPKLIRLDSVKKM